MAKKKRIYRLTKKDKNRIEKNWHREPYADYGGKALDYLKNYRAERLAIVKKAKEEAQRIAKKKERSLNYYRRNPIIIKGKPLPVDSLSFDLLIAEANNMNVSPRVLARQYEKSGSIKSTASITVREQSLFGSFKEKDVIKINGRKSSRAALKKRLAEIRHIAANFSTGFDMHITYEYDYTGTVYFNMPTYPELSEVYDKESFVDFFDNFDDISITISEEY